MPASRPPGVAISSIAFFAGNALDDANDEPGSWRLECAGASARRLRTMTGDLALPAPSPEAARAQRAAGRAHPRGDRRGRRTDSFERYMELALYAPGLGYYSAGAAKLGAAGDFITAAETSPLYAHCLAAQCAEILAAIGDGSVLELGAGSGALAAGMLASLAREEPAAGAIPDPRPQRRSAGAAARDDPAPRSGTRGARRVARSTAARALPRRDRRERSRRCAAGRALPHRGRSGWRNGAAGSPATAAASAARIEALDVDERGRRLRARRASRGRGARRRRARDRERSRRRCPPASAPSAGPRSTRGSRSVTDALERGVMLASTTACRGASTTARSARAARCSAPYRAQHRRERWLAEREPR